VSALVYDAGRQIQKMQQNGGLMAALQVPILIKLESKQSGEWVRNT